MHTELSCLSSSTTSDDLFEVLQEICVRAGNEASSSVFLLHTVRRLLPYMGARRYRNIM